MLSIDDFQPHLGEPFEVDLGESSVAFVLEAVEALAGSPRPSGGFRLDFRGPANPLLEQGSYLFERGGFREELFIVPRSQDELACTYEAVFF